LSAAESQAAVEALATTERRAAAAALETISMLVYNAEGRVLRIEIEPRKLASDSLLGRLQGELFLNGEAPRLLATSSSEELLLIFSSGRVAAMPAKSIQAVAAGDRALEWGKAAIPDEPRGGETLACIMPISKMALSEFFLQSSRRGYVKKIGASMAQSILNNRYIGTGVKLPADRMFNVSLGSKEDRLALVSQDGYLQCLEVKDLPFSTEETVRLSQTDHLAAAFVAGLQPGTGQSVLIMTQIGKVVQITSDNVEIASSFKTKGQAVLSARRRADGVQVIGAAAVGEEDWGAAIHQDGRVTLHAVRDLFGTGTLAVQGSLLAFIAFSTSVLGVARNG
jgi:DNA gyrase/topoisomerase IV subunit A